MQAFLSSSLELNKELINSDGVTCLNIDRLNLALAFALQDVLHLHCLNDA